MEAIVLAGGFGTRLAHVVADLPKPMAPVAGRPFLEYIIDNLHRQGISKIILAVHYKKEYIMEHFKNSYHGTEILYSVEESPLLTGGAIKKALTLCRDEYVWVINGDTYFDVPITQMAHSAQKTGRPVTIAVKSMQQFNRYGKVDVNSSRVVTAFHEKAFCPEGLINGGVYYMKKDCLQACPTVFSLENEYFPKLLEEEGIGAFPCEGYFIDIGVPEDFYAAQKHFKIPFLK